MVKNSIIKINKLAISTKQPAFLYYYSQVSSFYKIAINITNLLAYF